MAVIWPLAFMSASDLPAARASAASFSISASICFSSASFSGLGRRGLVTTGIFWKYPGME